MAAYMRLGERTFFIYDHSVTKKEDDDPKDAIIYFFPQNTSVDVQCIFCSQLMGMVNCTKTIAGSPPKLYKLRRHKVATLHEGNFTLALACRMRTPDSAIIQKLENLYRVFVFYHGSIAHVKKICSKHEAFLSSMASIWDFYVPYVRRYGNTVPAIFEPIPRVQLYKGGNFLFLRCSHLLQWLKSQTSLLAGCILYKRSVLCSQLSPELTSHMLLIKPNQLHHPSKSVTDTVLPFGVRIMSVYVSPEQYEELSHTPDPALASPAFSQAQRPDPAPDAVPSPLAAGPATAPEPPSGARSKRRPAKRNSSVTGRLFSNFTGMLEGAVVESLWPTTTPASESASLPRRQSLRGSCSGGGSGGSPTEETASFRDGDGNEVSLSRSGEDVLRALQGDAGSGVGAGDQARVGGGRPGDGVSQSLTPHLTRDFRSSDVCPEDDSSLTETELPEGSFYLDDEKDGSSLHSDARDSCNYQRTVVSDASHKQPDKALRLVSALSQDGGEPRSLGIGGSDEQPGLGGLDKEDSMSDSVRDAIPDAAVDKCGSAQELPVGSLTRTETDIEDEIGHKGPVSKAGVPQSNTPIETVTEETESHCDASTKDVQLHEAGIQCTVGDLPPQEPANSVEVHATDSNSSPHLANEGQPSVEEEPSVSSKSEGRGDTHDRDGVTPDILQGSHEDREKNPDLLRSSEKTASCDNGTGVFVEDVNSNIELEKAEDDVIDLAAVQSRFAASNLKGQITDASVNEESGPELADGENQPEMLASTTDPLNESLSDPEKQAVLHARLTRTDEQADAASGMEPSDETYADSLEETLKVAGDLKPTEIAAERDKDSDEPLPGQTGIPKPEQHFETVPGLINLGLYVQAHSDTTLLFLAEKEIMSEQESLFQLWQSVLRELGELELQLKTVVKPDREVDGQVSHHFLHFDNRDRGLEGSITNPVNQEESIFCRGVQVFHEQFLSDQTLTDITLRNQQTVVYGHQNACHHTFFHKNYKAIPNPGIPARDDPGFYIQGSCKEAAKEYNKNWL